MHRFQNALEAVASTLGATKHDTRQSDSLFSLLLSGLDIDPNRKNMDERAPLHQTGDCKPGELQGYSSIIRLSKLTQGISLAKRHSIVQETHQV